MAKGRYKRKQEAANDPRNNKKLSYFAADGAFGDAEGYVIMETTWWDEVDWKIIKDAQPKYRPTISRILTESYEPNYDEAALREMLLRYGVKMEKYEKMYAELEARKK
jgi:hypothetical protein